MEDDVSSHKYRWLPAAAAAGVVFVIAGLLCWQSWQRWGDPIVDLGRDLYIPGRLLDGAVLYRDILYNYGPLAPYLFAGLASVFGDSLWVFELAGALTGLGTLFLLWRLCVSVAGVRVALTTAVLFVVFSLFAHSTFGSNFILPYSFSATVGTLLALVAVQPLVVSRPTETMRLIATVAAGLTLLTKVEIGLAVLAVHFVSWVRDRPSGRFLIMASLATLAVVSLCLWPFRAQWPGDHELFRDNLLRFAGSDTPAFFSSVSGFLWAEDRFAEHLEALVRVSVLAALVAAGLYIHQRRTKAGRSIGLAVPGLAVLFLAATAAWGDVLLFRAVPFLAVGSLAWCAIRDWRSPLLPLSIFVLALAPRILLSYTPEWYGFYLAVPAYPFVAYLFQHQLPQASFSRAVAAVAMGAVVLAMSYHAEVDMSRDYGAMTGIVQTPKGVMRDLPGRAHAITDFCDYIREHSTPGETAVIFPEGVTLNYFTGLENPTAYYNFIPPEIPSADEETRILDELRRGQPSLIVLTNRKVGEFGKRSFGVDYAQSLLKWISDNYVIERAFGADEFGQPYLILMQRAE